MASNFSAKFSRPYRTVHLIAATLGMAALLMLLVERGWRLALAPPYLQPALQLYRTVVYLFALQFGLGLLRLRPWARFWRGMLADGGLLSVALLLLATRDSPRAAFAVIAMRQSLRLVQSLMQAGPVRPWLNALEAKPMRMVALSFLVAIGLGTGLLSLPASSLAGHRAGGVDALFTSTSAVCVTGLIVRSTPHDWSLFGQGVILILIQVGGLGIMALSVSVVMLLGHRLRMRQQAAMFQAMDVATVSGLRASLKYLLLLTGTFELVGFLILTLRFRVEAPSWGRAAWLGLFHSVSAWNNAGFSLWDRSLMGYQSDLIVNLTVAGLVVAGGLGFAVLGQLLDPGLLGRGGRRIRWSVHTKLVLTMTGVLLVAGTIIILFVEFDTGLAGLSPGQKIVAAFFQSVTARTAGFNSVDLSRFSSLGLLLMMVLMYIGASPGSTGGGIKTSTVAVLLLAVRALIFNRADVEVFKRRVSQRVILRVVGIVVVSAVVILLFFTLLLVLEPGRRFEWLLFETVSAFGTVGLSTGITASLGTASKLILIVLMFIGRTGPLTLALAIGRGDAPSAVQYPRGQVVVG